MERRTDLITFNTYCQSAANAALQAYTLTGRPESHPGTYEAIALDCFKRAAAALGYDVVKHEAAATSEAA